MTAKDFRRIALSLEGAEEGAHFGAVDFRVGGRIFATRGDDKCTMDQLTQRSLPDQTGLRIWRIEGRGFCVAPATALAGPGRIVVSRFDFAGRIEFSGRS